jgi:hypothetical protein
MRSNLILFVPVLVNQNFIGTRDECKDDDEYEKENDDEGVSRRALAQRTKAAHLTSVICHLSPDT